MALNKISSNIITSIGNTPLIDVSQLSPDPKIQIFGKLESSNPTGSVKDRVAKSLILNAEKEGKISQGSTILEPTSGNTGIGLAMLGSTRGYKIKVVMPADVPPERIDILKAFGAEVIFSDAGKGTNESINLAKQISNDNPNYYMPYQYGNEANPKAHYETTGPEIITDLPDTDVFIAGLGTGGTLMGAGKFLKEYNSNIQIIATAPHPDEKVQGLRAIEHGFIPPIIDLEKLDGRVLIEGEEAFYWTRKLLVDMGIFVGVSSGATFATARKIAEKMSKEGKSGKIVTIFCDGGWKYLSTGIYSENFKYDQKEIEGKTWW
ncbi:MAG: cysteine synthase family protein [SAR202 cluster bacterium]|nr:cysteine synthase family protein [SAR202 cluster bacterium]|tara:strand:+ start:2790 stop:3749 length:960 start_codon:yes stop_codon:yes gene_type:complete